MKKCRFVCVLFALLLLLTACGRETAEPETAGVQESTEASMESQELEELQETESRNLIVYFSRWGNTEFPDDVDADSYASIVISGDNEYGITEYITRFIQENVGGDIHLIQTAEPYPVGFEVLREQNVEEMDTGFLPELKESSLDLPAYDTVFVGYPIWAMDAPQAIFSLLAEYDLTGKRIVPFSTHHGYGAGSSYQHIAETVPGALPGLSAAFCRDCGFWLDGGYAGQGWSVCGIRYALSTDSGYKGVYRSDRFRGYGSHAGRTEALKIARLGGDEGWQKRSTGNLYISGIILNCSWGRFFPIGF